MNLIKRILNLSLVVQILIGILLGAAFGSLIPMTGEMLGILGDLFVKALKAIAPLLIFVLVMSSIANRQANTQNNMRPIISLYLIGTFMAALVAVVLSFLFPTTLTLVTEGASSTAPQGIGEVLRTLLFKIVDNPINALLTGNFIGVLAWAIGLGVAFHHSSDSSKKMLLDASNGVSYLVRFIIRLAPIGILGLVANTIAKTGFSVLTDYAHLLLVLLGAMLIIALIINPLMVFIVTRTNPYPLVSRCLRESGVTAFFTRSSAANIPVNIELCKKLKLDKDTYSVSIPLGATINMAGAAITITVLTLATAHTLDIHLSLTSTLLLSLVASLSACGASGVAGGSLLLIPLACNLFGISTDVAMQVVATGFIIGVVQDSAETALNSSTDVVFTAAVCNSKL